MKGMEPSFQQKKLEILFRHPTSPAIFLLMDSTVQNSLSTVHSYLQVQPAPPPPPPPRVGG
jgi:hypothetical protein